MATCPNCGEDNPDRAKFCLECATALKAGAPRADERKIVSILFVDLVGFTARSHDADPEDIRAALHPYHERLRQESERYGGTVEKFIGDAVMSVFGVPVAHEDDAERAVRAALRITEAIQEINENGAPYELAIRAAVNTGEVLVSLSEEMGRGLVGDVVNTASRLQGVAPVNGIVVGEAAYRATRGVIDYEPLEPVTVKGKPEPLPIWRVVAARSRSGVDVDLAPKTPFVGRELDLAVLRNAYQSTLREASVQLVTITGEPGVGKTRLLSEFSSYVDEQDELVYWRQGRSLPYGEGITFWALGEIIKAHAGILESDTPQNAAKKLRSAVEAVVDDTEERTWFDARLRPLVGAKVSGTEGGAEKEESFAAWRRFLAAIASHGPLILVFEDLHWADAAMLAFIDYLVESSDRVPILVLCTARPELYERHPDWGRSKRNSITISLVALNDSQIAQLISSLLSQAVLPARTHAALLERAGGNPLYAEEFIRMLSDRGVLQRAGRVLTIDPDADITIPETVQALIAARLDALPLHRKVLLHDASVAGKVFWSGAVASLSGRDEDEVREGLHELVRKELVRPARNSSMEGQQEYSFWHALVRDVAWGQIPRVERGRKHQAMAQWLEAMAGDRVGDLAEVLVHHYSQALNLAKAAGDPRSEGLIAPTIRFLLLAGDRVFNLDVARAGTYFARALELLPSGHPERAPTLLKAGNCAFGQGSLEEAERLFSEAITEARKDSDSTTEAKAMLRLFNLRWWKGDWARSDDLLVEARNILERRQPGPDLVAAYASAAERASSLGQLRVALEWSERALALALQLDDEKLTVAASRQRALARCDLGDPEGLTEIRRALQDSLKLGLSIETVLAYDNLSELTWWIEGPSPAAKTYRDFIQFAKGRGLMADATFGKAQSLRVLFDLGEWDDILDTAPELLRWGDEHGVSQLEAVVLFTEAQVWLFRGRTHDASAIEGRLVGLADKIGDLQVLIPALAVAASVEQAQGHTMKARALITELDHATREHPGWRARYLPIVIRTLISGGQADEAEKLMRGVEVSAARDQHCLLTGRAIVTEAEGRIREARDLYCEVAQRWATYGHVLEEGQAHLGIGRCLMALGDREAASEPLQKARSVFTRLRALPLLNEVDGYLGEAEAPSG